MCRPTPRTVLASCSALLLAGCFQEAKVKLTVHPDASGEVEVVYRGDLAALQEQMAGMSGMLGGAPAGGGALNRNPFDTAGPGELPGALSMAVSAYLADVARPDENGRSMTFTKNPDGSFLLSMEVAQMELEEAVAKVNEMSGSLGALADPGAVGEEAKKMVEEMSFRFEVTVPGEILKSSFPNREGRTTWYEGKGKAGMEDLKKIGTLRIECGPATPEAMKAQEAFRPVLEKARAAAAKLKKSVEKAAPPPGQK